MGKRFPFDTHIAMTAAAGFRIHKEVGWNDAAHVGCADDGKNGDFGPPLSDSIDAGAVRAFRIRSSLGGNVLRYAVAAAGKSTTAATRTAAAWRYLI